MDKKEGDDFAARVYVAFRLPPTSMNAATRRKLWLARMLFSEWAPDAAVNYVWDNVHPIGTTRRSAYTDRSQMIVLRTGAAEAGRWVEERRDVLADAKAAFGDTAMAATLLAVASDTDNTGESAHAGFADLHFVSRSSQCAFSAPR